LEPKEGITFIGHNPGDEEKKNVFIATGDSGNGITHGTIAGIILTDLILGKLIHEFLFIIHQEFQEKNLTIPKTLKRKRKIIIIINKDHHLLQRIKILK
jgi:hypothetical protein